MKRAFIGCIHGIESEPVSDGETAVYSDGESSTSETESLYQVQDGLFGGYSDGSSISDPFEPPSRVGIFMDGAQPVQNPASGSGSPVPSPDQVLASIREARKGAN